jgi:hypothetical protein
MRVQAIEFKKKHYKHRTKQESDSEDGETKEDRLQPVRTDASVALDY